jgi:hypothetical protein
VYVWNLQEELHVVHGEHTKDFDEHLKKMQEKGQEMLLSMEERAIVEQKRAEQRGMHSISALPIHADFTYS